MQMCLLKILKKISLKKSKSFTASTFNYILHKVVSIQLTYSAPQKSRTTLCYSTSTIQAYRVHVPN